MWYAYAYWDGELSARADTKGAAYAAVFAYGGKRLRDGVYELNDSIAVVNGLSLLTRVYGFTLHDLDTLGVDYTGNIKTRSLTVEYAELYNYMRDTDVLTYGYDAPPVVLQMNQFLFETVQFETYLNWCNGKKAELEKTDINFAKSLGGKYLQVYVSPESTMADRAGVEKRMTG